MNLFLSPHSDDETLFGAFTLMREHPLVLILTNSIIQWKRGTGISADQRWGETKKAMEILECPVIRIGIPDDTINEEIVVDALTRFHGFKTVYAPAVMGGNPHHDIIGKVANSVFRGNVESYVTYEKDNLSPVGVRGVIPTTEELEKKYKAMACYQSQWNYPPTKPHFESMIGRAEWFI